MGYAVLLIIGVVAVLLGGPLISYGWRTNKHDVGCIGTGLFLLGLAALCIWWVYAHYSFTRK